MRTPEHLQANTHPRTGGEISVPGFKAASLPLWIALQSSPHMLLEPTSRRCSAPAMPMTTRITANKWAPNKHRHCFSFHSNQWDLHARLPPTGKSAMAQDLPSRMQSNYFELIFCPPPPFQISWLVFCYRCCWEIQLLLATLPQRTYTCMRTHTLPAFFCHQWLFGTNCKEFHEKQQEGWWIRKGRGSKNSIPL